MVDPQGWISTTPACTRLIRPVRSSIASIGSLSPVSTRRTLLSNPCHGCLAKKHLAPVPEGQRSRLNGRPATDVRVEVGQALLGDSRFFPENSIRMRKADANWGWQNAGLRSLQRRLQNNFFS